MIRCSLTTLLSVGLAVAAATAVLLAVALVAKATEPPPIVVVPGAAAQTIVRAGEVPDALVRDVAIEFICELDNFLPATIEKSSEWLKTRFAPRFAREAEKMLDSRKRLVVDSRMSSQVVVHDPSAVVVRRTPEGYEVELTATRRIWVADKLTQEGAVVYRVVLESASPSVSNPHGLSVARISAALAKPQEEPR